MPHAQALKTAAIITAAALEQLAVVHGCSVADVVGGLQTGNVKLSDQFAELLALGATAV